MVYPNIASPGYICTDKSQYATFCLLCHDVLAVVLWSMVHDHLQSKSSQLRLMLSRGSVHHTVFKALYSRIPLTCYRRMSDHSARKTELLNNLQSIQDRIPSDSHVVLVAVSKLKPASDIQIAYDSGHRHFGKPNFAHQMGKSNPDDFRGKLHSRTYSESKRIA